MSSDERVRRQHYVPRMYLRNFVFDKEHERIWVFKKDNGTSFASSIMNIAQEQYFYDFTIDEDHPAGIRENEQIVEKFFADLEGDIAPLLRKVITTCTLTATKSLVHKAVFTNEERIAMSVFVTFQMLRTRLMRDYLVEMRERAMEAYLRHELNLPTDLFEHYKVELKQTGHSLVHANTMFGDELLHLKLAHILYSHIWSVAVNQSEHPFYTSDAPVTCYNYDSGSLGIGGLGQYGAEITLPLTSDLTLIMRERSYFKESSGYENLYVIFDKAATDEINERQVLTADKFVFCKEDRFELARKITSTVETPKKVIGSILIS